MAPAGRDPVRGFLTWCVEGGRMPGAAWWIQGPRGPVSSGAVGHAMLAPRAEPLHDRTPFDLASLTKPVATGLLLGMLEERGELDLEAPSGEMLEEMRTSPYASCSLLELATHTAGLPAWRPMYVGNASVDGYLEAISRMPPAVDRGKTLYSDLGYVLLGVVLERAARRPLDRLFAEEVARPLGLARMGYARRGAGFRDAAATERGNDYERAMAGASGEAHGWRTEILRGEVHDANAHGLDGVAGHAGLFGSVDEVAAVASEIVRPSGRLPLGPRARSRLLNPVAGTDGRTVGMVTARYARAARGILADGAPGHTGFTGTSLWLEPASAAVLVLLTNRVHPQVPRRDFSLVRRGFHRLARRMLRS